MAITPDSVKRLVAARLEVSVQRGAGAGAYISDADYAIAGARIELDALSLWRSADVIAKVRPPSRDEIAMMRERAAIVGILSPFADPVRIAELTARRAIGLAADLVPRSTLAQMMDVLSSQASLAGYRAVILAAEASPKIFPMMMTAAGTISPARVLVLGAGVAGLQAIATARRLGAVVEAFDVRKAAREQVESLGARFIEVPSEEDGSGAGGYAKEVSADYQKKQAALVTQALARADVAITTALVPGRRAPVLITAEQVRGMRPGSVIVDLAAEQGGNCELTEGSHRQVTDHGVTVIGEMNLPGQIAVHASQLYSRNMEKLLLHVIRDGSLVLEPSDPIVSAMLVCKDGEVVHSLVATAVAAAAQKEAA